MVNIDAFQAHILVVDDDHRLRDLLRDYLSEHNFRVTTAHDSKDAQKKLEYFIFDLIILDVMMPGESGLDLAQHLRQTSLVPILLLTALGETEDRISGLETGADDYLVKPFEPRELLLRIQTILRRIQSNAAPVLTQIHMGKYRFDIDREELWSDQTRIHLTSTEVSLLKTLAKQPGQVVSRETLTELCKIDGGDRAVDVQVTRLRRKIEDDPRFPRYLQTVRGHGYMLRPD